MAIGGSTAGPHEPAPSGSSSDLAKGTRKSLFTGPPPTPNGRCWGFLTVLAMARRPDVFSAGVAGAPVVDWGGYDSTYTERYLGLPADNPEGYERSSLLGQVDGLRGRLLILHGTIDENVHPRHTAELVEALRAAGHEASVVMIPDERHLLSRVESRRRWLTLAVDHLRDASNEPTADVGRPGVPPGQAAS